MWSVKTTRHSNQRQKKGLKLSLTALTEVRTLVRTDLVVARMRM